MQNELSFILEKTTSAICYLDAHGIVKFVNNSFCNLFKIQKTEVIGKTPEYILEKVSSEDSQKIQSEYSKIFTNREELYGEYTVTLKTGKKLVLEVSLKFFTDSLNQTTAILFLDDITYFRDSELALIQTYKSLLDLQFAIDQSSIVTVTDSAGTIIQANDNFLKISGYERNEVLGKNHRIIKSGYHPDSFFVDLWKTISSGKVWHGEIKNRRKNGTTYWVDSHIIPFLDENKKPFQYLSIRNDISLKKNAEDLLAASEQKYRLLYENAPIGIMLVDIDGNIVETNQYLLQLLGYDRNEFVGSKYLDYVQEEFREYKVNAYSQLLQKKTSQIYVEEKIKVKNGNYVWLGCYSNGFFSKEGNFLFELSFIVDIENRKKSEEALLKLDESKNAILNIVAHDLRSPIGGIISLIQIMLEEESNPMNRKYLELAEISGIHTLNIANDILEVSQVSDPNNFLLKELTDLNHFLKECIQFQELQAYDKSIQIEFKSSVEKIYAEINRDKMLRAITNLLSNAIKFTRESGKIELSLSLKDKHPLITIKDNGIGIPKNKQPFLFEKFSSARRAGTRGEKSTGLGMFIVKEIIDKHSGKLTFESEENKGTIFYIEL